ncbi:nucleotidyltransferase substrate binding protein [Candidatus Uhrbacteria bacterium]|nr:nucleotidyltransferase substrate binding protein [Candidatus Uhrbacteria bacterium]
MTHQLILTPLQVAVASLEAAIETPETGLSPLQENMRRDAIIQRFECTFELCWKMMKRTIEQIGGREETDDLFSKKDLFRRAHEAALIKDPGAWFAYLLARNQTSHAYDKKKAEAVHAKAIHFAIDARALLTKLEETYAPSHTS